MKEGRLKGLLIRPSVNSETFLLSFESAVDSETIEPIEANEDRDHDKLFMLNDPEHLLLGNVADALPSDISERELSPSKLAGETLEFPSTLNDALLKNAAFCEEFLPIESHL